MAANGILITRPEGQGNTLGEAAARLGLRPCYQPLIELEPLQDLPGEQRQLVQNLDLYQHVIFISGNAVRYAMPWLEKQWPQWPVGVTWYAVGTGTARALADFGPDPLTPGEEMNSEGLLRLAPLRDLRGERVLVVKGEGGRELLGNELQRRGARVDQLACYRRRPVRLPENSLARCLDEEQVVLVMISSGEGLSNFVALLSPTETTKLRCVTLLLPSRRVAGMAQAAGFERVLVADNASDDAMLRALEQWQKSPGDH